MPSTGHIQTVVGGVFMCVRVCVCVCLCVTKYLHEDKHTDSEAATIIRMSKGLGENVPYQGRELWLQEEVRKGNVVVKKCKEMKIQHFLVSLNTQTAPYNVFRAKHN